MTRPVVRFTVYGRPIPQGSKRHVGNGVMVESSKNLRPWRQDVADTAFLNFGAMPYAGDGSESIVVRVVFHFEKPRSAKKRVYPTVKPDIDKCLRAILDALTGIAYKDDAQVIEVKTQKLYGSPARAEIEVSAL